MAKSADREGVVEVTAADWSLVERYRFGSRTADYLLCRRCGVYIGAFCETSAGLRAVVNVNCLADLNIFYRSHHRSRSYLRRMSCCERTPISRWVCYTAYACHFGITCDANNMVLAN